MNAPVDIKSYMLEVGRRARAASRELARADTAAKNRALVAAAKAVRRDAKKLLAANADDAKGARVAGKDAAFIDRLTLTEKSIEGMAQGLEQVAQLPDPVGEVTELRDLLQALRHALDAFFGQRETVDECRVLARDARPLRVIGVRGEKLLRVAPHRFGGGDERAVLGRGVGAGELARCGPRPAADLEHVGLDVQRSVHERILPPGGRGGRSVNFRASLEQGVGS